MRKNFQKSFETIELGNFIHTCGNQLIVKLSCLNIPYPNSPVLYNEKVIGKVDEVLGSINEVYTSVRLDENGIKIKEGTTLKAYKDKFMYKDKFKTREEVEKNKELFDKKKSTSKNEDRNKKSINKFDNSSSKKRFTKADSARKSFGESGNKKKWDFTISGKRNNDDMKRGNSSSYNNRDFDKEREQGRGNQRYDKKKSSLNKKFDSKRRKTDSVSVTHKRFDD